MKARWSPALVAVVALAAAAWFVPPCPAAEGQPEKVTLDQVPAAVRQALERECPEATIRQLTKETENGKVLYDFEVTKDGKAFEFDIAADGQVLSREEQVQLSQLPPAVRQTIQRTGKPRKIGTIMKISEKGETSYEVEIATRGKIAEVEIAADGKLISGAAKPEKEKGKEKAARKEERRKAKGKEARRERKGERRELEKEENEEVVKVSQLPRAVQKTLKRESLGGTLGEITKETEDGKIIYSADLKMGGDKYEIEIAADGKLIKKALEEESDEERKPQREEKGKREKTGKKDAKPPAGKKETSEWMDSFDVDKADLASTGKNPFFILEPGYVLKFKGTGGDELTITVLNETKVIDGVETRVVEERETTDGQLKEISLNWFAISKKTGDVYYFGEDSRDHKDGKVVSQGGSWESGKNGARFGLMMPAKPKIGQKYCQEIAPNVAMDRAENVSLSETLKVPAGKFTNCLKTEESTPLEKGKEYKVYAPGVGLLKDEDFVLVSYGFERGKGK